MSGCDYVNVCVRVCALFIYVGCVCVHCHLDVCIFCCVCLLDVKASTMRESVSLLAGLCARQYNWAFVCTCVCLCLCVCGGTKCVLLCICICIWVKRIYKSRTLTQTCRCISCRERLLSLYFLFLFCAYVSTCMQQFVGFKELEGTCQCCDGTSMVV